LRRTLDALEATLQIARALGGETDLAKILELVAKRGRALVSARALVIEHEHGRQMVVTAGAGDLPDGLIGRRVDMLDSVAGAALRTLKTLRLEDDANRVRFERHGLGRLGFKASAGLIVPLLFRGAGHGVLIAIDRLEGGPAFTAEDQRLLEAFAASAATAVATAEMVEAERRRHRLAAAEQERARWARELHDETLQSLAALRVGLATQLRSAEPSPLAETVRDAVADLEREIVNLRALITDLRPAALDDVGAGAAIEDLAERARGRGLEVDTSVNLSYEQGRASERHTVELETALYRIVQEALTNAVRHGGARRASVEIEEDESAVRITIRDDGTGFDTGVKATGFGLVGMRERAELLDGTFQVESEPERGTTIRAVLPVQRRRSAQAA
jgi:signal transduction histidine kinase